MTRYEIVFMDHGGTVYSRSELEAPDDTSAIAMARRIHKSGVGSGYSILNNGQLVHTEKFGASPKQ